jgi:leucyl-tRNA synthetase
MNPFVAFFVMLILLLLLLLLLLFYLLLDQMAKSTGNFITLSDAISEYSADATRFALADAGDGLEDANFERASANAAILKLTREEAWMRELVEWDDKNAANKLRIGPLNFFDRILLNEIQACVIGAEASYSKLQFREALKFSWQQLTMERDNYKLAMDAEKHMERMHRDVLWAYLEALAILLSPICPHFCQHMWHMTGLDAARNIRFVFQAVWPKVTAGGFDLLLHRQINYLRDATLVLRKGYTEALVRSSKAPKQKADKQAQVVANRCTLYIAADYPEWQATVLKLIDSAWEELNGRAADVHPERKLIIAKLRGALPAQDKKLVENSTKFANSALEDLAIRGAPALELTSPFSEQELLEAHLDFVLHDLGIQKKDVEIKTKHEGMAMPASQTQQVEVLTATKALPGRPSPFFFFGPKNE